MCAAVACRTRYHEHGTRGTLDSMDIGKPKRIIEIEPATLPVPEFAPEPERRVEPDGPAIEPEPAVPADPRSA